MPNQRGTLEVVATAAAGLLAPLEERLEGGEIRTLLAELGLQLPASVEAGAAANALHTALQRLRDLPQLLTQLSAAIEAENVGQIVSKGLELANTVKSVIEAIEALASAIKALGAAGIPPTELNDFADHLPERLIDYLIVRNLEPIPGVAESLEFIDVVERSAVPGVDAAHPPFVRRAFHLDALTGFVSDPLGRLGAIYQWGSPGFDGMALLGALHRIITRAGIPAVLDTTGPRPVLDLLFVEISPKTDVHPPGLAMRLTQKITVDPAPFRQDDIELRAILNTTFDSGIEITFQPNDGVTFTPPGGAGTRIEGDLMAELTAGRTGRPYLILGQAGGSRLEAQQLVARAGVGFAWNAANNRAEGSFSIAGEVRNGKLVVDLSSADGFLGTLLSGFRMESDFNLGFGFSTREGLFFTGSATLDIQIPLHLALGPVEISALTLTVGIEGSTFPIGIAADIKAALGPIQAVVQQIGVEADLSVPANRKGNSGPVDVAIHFKPPNGVGISVDAGVIKGGGFLFFDDARGEYGGALELTFANFLSLKAIGLITTRLPDGTRGFSLIVIITVEFGTGIQLGFGFTLIGVGGILGLNRGVNLQPLIEGVRSGAVNNILFPRDIVANAPRILSDIRAIFPPELDVFVVGPLAKFGWGTPTLISLTLGIIIEIPPGNIAIIGVLRVALPTEQAAVLRLQVLFVGALEFDKKRIYFFAGLFDSRILTIPIEGEMGLLMAYGDDPNFVLSVGGFHPAFSPPPMPIPVPRRVAIVLVNTAAARVRIEGYFAVTSNTVQFGARADIFFGIDAGNVQGFIAFDALFQFSPFRFVITISASFSLNALGFSLFSVRIRGQLEGTSPWRASGEGSVSLLFFDISADFDVTWGESRDTTLPPIAVLPLFRAEIEKKENWRALLPEGNNLLVTLRKLPESDTLVLHPVGVLRVAQRALPLDLKLDKVGTQKPSDVNRLSLTVTGGALAKKGDAEERFAPAQFQNYSDAEKLSRPAYTRQHAGVELSAAGSDTRSSRCIQRIVRYEQVILDNNYKRFIKPFFVFTASLFHFFLGGASVTLSELSQAKKKKLQPFTAKVGVADDTYSVALQATNRAYSAETIAFRSEASARDFMEREVHRDPNLADVIHVIPSVERAA